MNNINNMEVFTDIVEAKKIEVVGVSDSQDYLDKMKNKLPKDANIALVYIINNHITDEETVNVISKAAKAELKKLSAENKWNFEEIVDLQKALKNLKGDIKVLPMYMSEQDRKNVLSGDKSLDDILLDLKSDKGRQACAKKYSPLAVSIATKYVGKSSLDRNQLISAAMLGLTKAMNDYHASDSKLDADTSISTAEKEEGKKRKALSFKQYAGWRIRNQILNDINDLSRTVRITQYEYEKNKSNGNSKGNYNSVSIDVFNDEEGRSTLDRLKELGEDPTVFKANASDEMKKFYNYIDSKVSTKMASQFYKYLGLNGYKEMKQTEIAKEYGVSGASINQNIKKVINICKSDPNIMKVLQDILALYTESLIANNYNSSKEEFIETLINDDIYIMLEEITHWQNKDVYNNAVGSALEYFEPEQADFIMDCLYNDFNFLDENYMNNKKILVRFLEHLYPTEYIKKRSDVVILNNISEISDMFKKHNLI